MKTTAFLSGYAALTRPTGVVVSFFGVIEYLFMIVRNTL